MLNKIETAAGHIMSFFVALENVLLGSGVRFVKAFYRMADKIK